MCGKLGCAECNHSGTQRVQIASTNTQNEDTAQGIGHTRRAHTPTREDISLAFQAELSRYIGLLKDQAFDYSHPVDEYGPQGSTSVVTNLVNLQPDYDMPEKIICVTVVVPIGATLAAVQLGQRTIEVYNGIALTASLLVNIQGTGIIVNADDPRQLQVTGTVTSAPYLGLTGWALTRGQFS